MPSYDLAKGFISPYHQREVIDDAARHITSELRNIFPCSQETASNAEGRRDARQQQLDRIRKDIAAIEARQEALRRCLSAEEDAYGKLIAQQSNILARAELDYQNGAITLPVFPVEIIAKIFWMTFCDPENPQVQNYTGVCALASLVKSLPSDEWKKVVFSAVPDFLSELFTGSTAVFTGETPDHNTLRERIKMTDPSRLVIKLNLHDTDMLDVLLDFEDRWSELDIAAYSLPTDADNRQVLSILKRCEHILPHLHTFNIDHKIAAPTSAVLGAFGGQHNAEHGIELKHATFSVTWIPYFEPLLTDIVDLTLYLHSIEDTVLKYLPSIMDLPFLRRLTLHQSIGWRIGEPEFDLDDHRRSFPTVEELCIKGVGPDVVSRFIQMFHCPKLRRLEIEAKVNRERKVTDVDRTELLRFIDRNHPHLKSLSAIWHGTIESHESHHLGSDALEVLCKPDEDGHWILPRLEELDEELKTLQPDLSSLIRLCRVRLQSRSVTPLRLLRIQMDSTSPSRLNMNALQFYVPEVVWIRRSSSKGP